MSVEVSKFPFKSLKAFAGEYLMIVVSVLTALAVERGAQTLEHRRAAQEAVESFDVEIQANVANYKKTMENNARQMKALVRLRSVLLQDMQAKLPEAKIVEHFKKEAKEDFNFLISWPNPRHEAWDVAVANGSAGWIAPGILRKYSDAYVNQRGMMEAIKDSQSTVLNGPEMVNVLNDLDAGTVSAPREVFHVLGQMIAAFNITDLIMTNTSGKLEKTFPMKKPEGK